MDRSEFIRSFVFAPAIVQGLAKGSFQETQDSGVRRLSWKQNFTSWLPIMDPAYYVNIGEVVLIEMSHGLPGMVTREGQFREPGPGDKVNPQTGPVFVDGILAGDSLAIDILDIKTGDWGYCSGRIFELMRSDSISTIGAHKNLEDAAWQATDDMITLLRHKTGRTEQEARLLVGLTGQLKINQIVDPNKGARMEVPSWVFGI